MSAPLTLIIDDEADIRELLELTLQRMQVQTKSAATVAEARALLKEHDFNLCLTDMKLPDGDGLELLDYIQQTTQNLPVVVITAFGNMDIAIRAMKKGAFDFMSKPINLAALRQLIQNALQLSKIEINRERRSRDTLLGDSPLICEVRSKIAKLALSQAPVYISGESGSGKELVAKLIHSHSPRASKPFIAVNCGAIPFDLMESEFFGHKKGSFTGASADKIGLFQAADGGTLFLDEVADLPAVLQVKLLRAIQEKKVRPIGEQQEIPVNVRLLSATHKNLAAMVQAGEFRQDLFYRINVIELNLPPLRARNEDIPLLVAHILKNLSQNHVLNQPTIAPRALAALQQYNFPGNVRELENILERALALYEGNSIEEEDLGLREHTPLNEANDGEHAAFDPSQSSLEDFLESIEKRALENALEKASWNKTAAAKQLGLTFRSLRYRLKKLGME